MKLKMRFPVCKVFLLDKWESLLRLELFHHCRSFHLHNAAFSKVFVGFFHCFPLFVCDLICKVRHERLSLSENIDAFLRMVFINYYY